MGFLRRKASIDNTNANDRLGSSSSHSHGSVDDLLTSQHQSASLLDGLDTAGGFLGGKKTSSMPRAMSMLEMNDINQMKDFALDMDGGTFLGGDDDDDAPQDQDDDDDDGGFFIDAPDDDDNNQILQMSTSPDSVMDVPQDNSPPDTLLSSAPSKRGGMRRVMSVSSLSSSAKPSFSLSAMMQDQMHSISEEGEATAATSSSPKDKNKGASSSTKNKKSMKNKKRDERPPGLVGVGDSSQSSTEPEETTMAVNFGDTPAAEPEETTMAVNFGDTPAASKSSSRIGSSGSRRPNRHLTPASGGGMPKRSAMKGSRNNLLQSSFTSTGSGNSGMDVSNHSLGSSSHRGMPTRSAMKGSRNNLLQSSFTSTGSGISGIEVSNHSLGSSQFMDNSMKRNVSFTSLEIRSYNVTLGDAPTSNGPAVSLDWEYDPNATVELNIDQYETYRTDEAPRRNRGEMLMPPMHRQYLLMREAGFTRGQIKVAMEEARRVARQREKTIQKSKWGFVQPVEEAGEKIKRKMKKLSVSRRLSVEKVSAK